MKRVKFFVAGLAFVTGLSFTSCKSKPKESEVKPETTETQAPSQAAPPVVVSTDETIQNGVKDATKDYPTVTATVNNGEITLNGELERSKLPGLMQSLSSLNAKKINNNLKLK